MPIQGFSPALQKVVGQIRYRPTLAGFRACSEIAQKIEKDFEDWQAGKEDNISLFNASNKEVFNVTSDSLTYSIENAHIDSEQDSGIKKTKKYLEYSLDYYVEHTEVQEIRRIGFRATNIYKCEYKFEELASILFEKFYNQKDKLRSLSSDEQRDVVFILEGKRGSLLNRVQIGPIRAEEVAGHIRSNFKIEDGDIPDVGLFVDVDVFKSSDLDTENTIDHLMMACKESFDITKGYLNLIAEI